VVGFLMAGAFFAYYLAPAVTLAVAALLSGGEGDPHLRRPGPEDSRQRGARRVLGNALSLLGRALFVGYVGAAVVNIASPGFVPPGGGTVSSWAALGVPLGMALCAAGHHRQMNRVLSDLASPQRFGATLERGSRLGAMAGLIVREQWSPVVGYGPTLRSGASAAFMNPGPSPWN
jgi:hypothetical protein